MSGLELNGVPGCTKCGVCCFSQSEDYLHVAEVDARRLGAELTQLTQRIDGRRYMKMQEGHCIALTYNARSDEFLCSIYEKRPDVCHWLERGSGQCATERREKQGRGLVMISRSRSEPR